MQRKCRRCSEEVEVTDRICPNCGHDTVTGRPVGKLRPEDPPAKEPESEKSNSLVATLLLVAIVLIYGFAAWRWFTADSEVAPVYGASRAVERNLNLRATMPQLSGSLQRFNAEIAKVRDSDPSDDESAALDSYDEAVEMLTDSLTVWATKVDEGAALNANSEHLAPLKEKYFLPVDDAGNLLPDQSLQIIWLKAQESLDAGNEFYAR